MLNLKKTIKQYYTEIEAAETLGITLEALHEILDEHVFTADHPRPEILELTHAEMILLSVWAEPERGKNVVTMPPRD